MIFKCPTYVHISSKDRSKFDPKLEKCIFVDYTKGAKEFKLWKPIKRKMVINIDVIFGEQLILKQTVATNVLTYEGETSCEHVIQVDYDPPPVNNMQVMPK